MKKYICIEPLRIFNDVLEYSLIAHALIDQLLDCLCYGQSLRYRKRLHADLAAYQDLCDLCIVHGRRKRVSARLILAVPAFALRPEPELARAGDDTVILQRLRNARGTGA